MNIKKRIYVLDARLLKYIKAIGALADKKGIRACLVGGFVRDMFLNLDNFDVDIILERDGIKFANLVSKTLKLNMISHERFGTAVLANNSIKIDIATFRKERYPYPGSLPVVSRGSLIEDLARRDFTINAMAVSINKNDFGLVFDYINGLTDLKQRRLRILHKKSFLDDPTRILRLVRFKARFNFSVENKTLGYIRQAKKSKALEKMQRHRIRDELILIFKEAKPENAIKDLSKVYGLDFIHKKLQFKKSDSKKFLQVRRIIVWFEANFKERRQLDVWLIYFIVFLSRLNLKQIRQVATTFGFKRGESIRLLSCQKSLNKVSRLLNNSGLSPSYVYKILNPLSYEVILILLCTLTNSGPKKYIKNFLRFYNLIRIKSGGDDLKKLGIKPGPNFKILLEKVKEEKLNLGFSSKREELTLLKKLIKK
ncbi:MAG: hypothetical protein KJ593_03710 [Candidatus Omnitrophica bacterium]|nr:hypothetical protein [Candidatus Omnitrophota bacterium]